MNSCKSLFFVLFAGSSFAANLEPLKVTGFSNTESCGAMSHEVNLAPGDSTTQCLRVYFKDFAISADKDQSVQRNCHMKATLRIPANMQFRATEAVAEGVYFIQGSGYGGFNLSYELKATKALGSWFEGFRPETRGDFNFTTKVASEAFTKCVPYETEVELTSDLHAFIDQLGTGHSYVSLDETGKRLSWNWKLQPCQADWYAQTLVGYYQSTSGRQYRTVIKIAGNEGTYTSDAGFAGKFFNIRRSDSGAVLEGEWGVPGTRSIGIFHFHMTDPESGKFEGIWKDAFGRVGRWWGENE
jgi:hypothetical protein